MVTWRVHLVKHNTSGLHQHLKAKRVGQTGSHHPPQECHFSNQECREVLWVLLSLPCSNQLVLDRLLQLSQWDNLSWWALIIMIMIIINKWIIIIIRISFFCGTLILSVLACEYSRFSLLLTAKDVSPGGTTAPQQQKFHTDDVISF